MSIAFSYEPAQAADLEALVRLRIEAMRDSLTALGRFDATRARERLVHGFEPSCTRHIVVQGRRVGFVVVKIAAEGLLLDHLYLEPREQGLGIGSAVLRQILNDADDRGVDVLVVALRGSSSNRFYTRHGFRQTDESEWDIC